MDIHVPNHSFSSPAFGRPPAPASRLLLVVDGTLTPVLEALYGEPTRVEILLSKKIPFEEESRLHPLPGETLLLRDILLRGKESGHIFLVASTTMIPDPLPVPLRREIEEGRKPLGLLWSLYGFEFHREFLDRELRPTRREDPEWVRTGEEVVYRESLIHSGGRALFHIREWLPFGVGKSGEENP